MLTVQRSFIYEGDAKRSPFPSVRMDVQFPTFEYTRAATSPFDVIRNDGLAATYSVNQEIANSEYRIAIETRNLIGRSGESVANFLFYSTRALASKRLEDLSLSIPIETATSESVLNAQTLKAIYLIRNMRSLFDAVGMLMRDHVGPEPAEVIPFLDANLILLNRQTYDELVPKFNQIAHRSDDWTLLSIIMNFLDQSDYEPRKRTVLNARSKKLLDRILQSENIEGRDDIVKLIAEALSGLFDFPVVLAEIEMLVVAGSFKVETAAGRSITPSDLNFYHLLLDATVQAREGGVQTRSFEYEWSNSRTPITANSTHFVFEQAGRIIKASLRDAVRVHVKGFDGSTIWSRSFDPDDPALRDAAIVVQELRPAILVSANQDLDVSREKRLRGQVLELTKECPLADLTVVLQAKKDGDELWRVVAASRTDASGNFSLPYPYGVYTAAQALVSLAPDAAADIPIVQRERPNETVADDFLYLLVREPQCPKADEQGKCDCCAPKSAPRLPDQTDLISSDEYTQDIGGSCINLSKPNRTLNEYAYSALVRTSDPDVANYTLVKNSDGSFQLQSNGKKIERSPVDITNPIMWQDAPDFKENLTFYQSVTVATGHVLHYKAIFKADGYSLGNLLYSLALAPGQKKQMVVIDSAHSLQGAETQTIAQGESLAASLLNERNITDQLGGNINESLRGSSAADTAGISAGLGVAANIGVVSGALGVAGGYSTSSASASQNGSRDTAMFFGEKLRQAVMQNAESYRQLNATVVTSVKEGQQYAVTTDVVANHNHCHALTMMYFEVLRHYAIFQEIVAVEECIFVPLLMTNFSQDNIYKWSDVLARNLLPISSNTYLQPFSFLRYRVRHPLIPAFDANERRKTNYAHVDFPAGAFSDEPITSVTGYATIRVNIPRPKSVYDRIMSFPIVKRESATNRNGGGVFGFIADVAVGKRLDIKTWEEKVKFTDEHIVIYDNFQEARPADVIEVIKFDNFFDSGSKDDLLWTTIADICGYSDVQAFLTNFFSHKTISQWDATFNEEILPIVFEVLVANTISITPFGPCDFTTVGRYNGGERLMRLNLRTDTSLPRKDIPAIGIVYAKTIKNPAEFWKFATLWIENLLISYTTKHYEGYIINKAIGDDLFDDVGPTGLVIKTPMNSDEQRNPRKEDQYLVLKLIEHLNSNIEYYNKVLWSRLDPDRRFMLLDGFNIQVYNDFGVPSARRSLASVVKNELLAITGNSLVFPVAAGYKVSQSYLSETDDDGVSRNVTLFDHYKPLTPVPPYRVSVPSRGVFLEAVQGACDACEKVKEGTSQDWTKFTTDEPTPVLPVSTPVPTITDWKAVFKEFAPPLVSIQNAPALPAPGAGLAGVTELLGKPGIFKDITGLDATQQNVIRTYLSNQENAKAFAEMAKSMLTQDHNTQHSDKIMDSLKSAKDTGAINQDEYGKLVKDHIQKQIDGGDAQTQQAAQQNKQLETSPIKSAVDLAQKGSKVTATETDSDGNMKTLDVDSNPRLQNASTFSQASSVLGQQLQQDELARRAQLTAADIESFTPTAENVLVSYAREWTPPEGMTVVNWRRTGLDHYGSLFKGRPIGGRTDATTPHSYPIRRLPIAIILHETVGWNIVGAGVGKVKDQNKVEHDYGFSVHFTVGPEGTVYQHNDIAQFLEHATKASPLSVGIEVTNGSVVDTAAKDALPLTPSGTTSFVRSLQTSVDVGGIVAEDRERLKVAWVDGTQVVAKPTFLYILPEQGQLEGVTQLVAWLCSGTNGTAVATFLNVNEQSHWRQHIVQTTGAGEAATTKHWFLLHGHPVWREKQMDDFDGIFAHTNFQADRSDGGPIGLYTWLRLYCGKTAADAYPLFRTLLSDKSVVHQIEVAKGRKAWAIDVSAVVPTTVDI